MPITTSAARFISDSANASSGGIPNMPHSTISPASCAPSAPGIACEKLAGAKRLEGGGVGFEGGEGFVKGHVARARQGSIRDRKAKFRDVDATARR